MYNPKSEGQVYFHYGLPEKILTNLGYNFESDLLKELCELAQVKKIGTLGYHSQTNGQCECFNVFRSICWVHCLKNQEIHGESRSHC